ncbi:FG-GAP-like repeat-containing protein [Streptomyces sp. NPDC003077]|uniref:FG-GAP-like repeat-containing protein n=1 Tax=Streptomyces sp. NPDC003077 TaxID=3154443 RepID=UPI0033AB632A
MSKRKSLRASSLRIRRLAVSAACTALFLTSTGSLAHAVGTVSTVPEPTVTAPSADPSAGTPKETPSGPASSSPTPEPGSTTRTPEPVTTPGDPAPEPDADGWTDADAIRFWTPERMASADDPAPAPGPDAPPATAPRQAAPRGLMAAAAMPKAEHFLGMKSVGVIFSYAKDPTTGEMRAHRCTASVVDSPGRDLVLTAGHCKGDNSVFVPWYRTEKSLAHQEYGFYRIANGDWFADKRYRNNSKAKISDLDFAFARLARSADGKNVQDVVGANRLSRTPGYINDVTMVGYPARKHDSADHSVRCPVKTSALPGFYQIQATCGGMFGGVSGGPWFSKIDGNGGTGEIIGNVGGYNGGGNDKNVDWITYSPLHGDWFFQLYDEAKKGVHGQRGSTYRQPPLPYSMGDGDLWKHAKLMASGDFDGTGRSDLLVVWTDGEVTLYNSDGKGRFTSERRLLAANGTWKYARTITAGDFTGSHQFDLMVGWSDGEVTLYGDVGGKGLDRAGTRMAARHSIWSKATQITAGRFNAAHYVTDLMVRWSDGELTLYTNVGAGTFGQEHKLRNPDPLWTHATLLTSGEFSGGGKWDLMVRWSDGELDTYAGTTTKALGAESRVLNANGLWTHDTVMTTGNYTGNGRTDDLVVRWSDGETTLYADTRSRRVGTERTLVAPGS